jgi:hypothetical protein
MLDLEFRLCHGGSLLTPHMQKPWLRRASRPLVSEKLTDWFE